jgi:hypothetical protein
MENLVAYLDFHGCLLRGARPNRVLNRYDRKRERDRGQSAFCVPINHFSPPSYPMSRSPSCSTKPLPDPRSPARYGSTTRVPASRYAERPTPERCVEAYYLQRPRFESIAERKLRRRQLTDDGNVEISERDLDWCNKRSLDF